MTCAYICWIYVYIEKRYDGINQMHQDKAEYAVCQPP